MGGDVTGLFESLTEIQAEHSNGHNIHTSPTFDVIVASDVVYGSDPVIWELLLTSIVKIANNVGSKVLILIAQTERYKESEDMFYARAAKLLRLVDVIDISGVASSNFCPGTTSRTRLYVMTSVRTTS